jgi:hypothetical protein
MFALEVLRVSDVQHGFKKCLMGCFLGKLIGCFFSQESWSVISPLTEKSIFYFLFLQNFSQVPLVNSVSRFYGLGTDWAVEPPNQSTLRKSCLESTKNPIVTCTIALSFWACIRLSTRCWAFLICDQTSGQTIIVHVARGTIFLPPKGKKLPTRENVFWPQVSAEDNTRLSPPQDLRQVWS